MIGPCRTRRLITPDRAKAMQGRTFALISNIIGSWLTRKLTSRTRRSHSCKEDGESRREIFCKSRILPGNHFDEGQMISQGYQLLPAIINKPIIASEIEIFVVEMCAGENCVSEVGSVPSEVVETYYIHPLTVVAYLDPNWPMSVKSSSPSCRRQNTR